MYKVRFPPGLFLTGKLKENQGQEGTTKCPTLKTLLFNYFRIIIIKETTSVSTNGGMNKENVAYICIHTMEYLAIKKKNEKFAPCDNMYGR